MGDSVLGGMRVLGASNLFIRTVRLLGSLPHGALRNRGVISCCMYFRGLCLCRTRCTASQGCIGGCLQVTGLCESSVVDLMPRSACECMIIRTPRLVSRKGDRRTVYLLGGFLPQLGSGAHRCTMTASVLTFTCRIINGGVWGCVAG